MLCVTHILPGAWWVVFVKSPFLEMLSIRLDKALGNEV